MNCICVIPSPVGLLTVSSDGVNITGLWIQGQKYFASTLDKLDNNTVACDLPIFDNVKQWLNCYFSGINPGFTLPLAPKGSPFRQEIWKILSEIPYGKTITYGEIAKIYNSQTQGKRTSPRAVGGAVGHNPISIIIPCHRVVGADRSLTGYAGGIHNKIYLLKLENADLLHESKL